MEYIYLQIIAFRTEMFMQTKVHTSSRVTCFTHHSSSLTSRSAKGICPTTFASLMGGFNWTLLPLPRGWCFLKASNTCQTNSFLAFPSYHRASSNTIPFVFWILHANFCSVARAYTFLRHCIETDRWLDWGSVSTKTGVCVCGGGNIGVDKNRLPSNQKTNQQHSWVQPRAHSSGAKPILATIVVTQLFMEFFRATNK